MFAIGRNDRAKMARNVNWISWKKLDSCDRAFVLILILCLFAYTYGIWWGLPSFDGWAADEIVPAKVLEAIAARFSQGWHYKYPPFHFYLLALFYSPILLLDSLNLVDITRLETYQVLFYIGRVLSVIFALGLLFLIYRCGQELYSKKAALFAAAIAALNCTFFYYAKLANLEAPYLFWVVLSFLFYLKILKFQRLQDYWLFSITAAIAVCTKDQAYGFYLLTPLFLIWQHHRVLKQQHKTITFKDSLLHPKIIGSLIIGLTMFALLHNLLFNLEGFIKHVEVITLGKGSIDPRYSQNLWGQLKMFRDSLTNLRFAMGWPLYGICLIGLANHLRHPQKKPLLNAFFVPILSYYLFYICVVWYSNIRYLIPIAIVLSFFGGQFLADFLTPAKKFFKAKLILIGAILLYTFAYSFTLNVLMVQDSRYMVEAWMKQHIPPTAFILGSGDDKYLPRLEGFNSQTLRKPTLADLPTLDPDYIILSSGYDIRRFRPNTPEHEFLSQLLAENLGYQLAFQYKSTPNWYLFNREEVEYRKLEKMRVYSNFDKINPEIKIFQKSR